MSIQNAAYEVCKAVISNEIRSDVRSVVGELSSGGPQKQGDANRGMFGYHARKQYAQFLGYLLVDQEKERFENSGFPERIPAISKNERHILLTAHQQIVSLNKLCVEPITKMYPESSEALNPYSRFITLSGSDEDYKPFLSSETIDSVVAAFKLHPALKKLQEVPSYLADGMNSIALQQGVHQNADLIRQAGLFGTPKGIQDFLFSQPYNSPARSAFRYIIALRSVQASLEVLDQMIYQSFFQDHIFTLGSESITDISKQTRNLVGSSIEISFQPNNELMLLEPVDVVLITAIPSHISQNLLCQVSSLSEQFSRDFGMMNKAGLHILDENLNYYDALLGQV